MSGKTLLLASVAWVCFALPALADDSAILARLDAMQAALDAQTREIAAQRTKIDSQAQEISRLRHSFGGGDRVAVAPVASSVSQQAQIDDLKSELGEYKNTQRLKEQDEPVVSYANGRPMVSSPDGRFTFALRSLAQFDMGYYDQSDDTRRLAAANGPSLGSGANFRRAALGIQGQLFGDWSYLFNYDFGGSSGNESQGRVQSVYLQYDGLKPFAFRIGAYPPPASLEDSTSATDTIFLERNAPADAARAIAGADGRDAVSAIYAGDALYAAISFTGGKVADSTTFAGEQTAFMGRVSDMVYSGDDWKVLVGVNGAYVIHPAYTNFAGPGGTHTASISSAPELTIDNTYTKLVSTGAINADHVTQWGLEAASQWRSLYAQAGYFGYAIERASALPDPDFDGWYAQASWVLTGEPRSYSKINGAFGAPKPRIPFSLNGGGGGGGAGAGAWEIAMRYSDLDLNFNEGSAGSATPAGGVRGGQQRIWTLGLNWYPNSLLRFSLNAEHIDVDRLGTTGAPVVANADVGQNLNAVALRTQFGF